MPLRLGDRSNIEERLRLSIVRAFQTGALLVSEERFLHGPLNPNVEGKFQSRALALLQAEPTISEAERAAVLPLGPDVWAEASRLVESHFETKTAIPDRDLAVYSPSVEHRVEQGLLDQVDQIARLALEAGGREMELPTAIEETTEEPAKEFELRRGHDQELMAPIASMPAVHEPDQAASIPFGAEIPEVRLPQIEGEAVEWDLSAAMDPSRLTPLPLVAAALEAVGLDEDQFGFLLRYGTFAPVGRTSEIKIAGLGLAEFSRRAADWFNALGASKFPIQVIDDGSGELTVYLLEGVPA